MTEIGRDHGASFVSGTDIRSSVHAMAKRGRPHKGDRVETMCRPQRAVRESCEASAREQGYESLGDYISAVLAEHEGLPHLAPQPVTKGVPLPLTA